MVSDKVLTGNPQTIETRLKVSFDGILTIKFSEKIKLNKFIKNKFTEQVKYGNYFSRNLAMKRKK